MVNWLNVNSLHGTWRASLRVTQLNARRKRVGSDNNELPRHLAQMLALTSGRYGPSGELPAERGPRC